MMMDIPEKIETLDENEIEDVTAADSGATAPIFLGWRDDWFRWPRPTELEDRKSPDDF
jgi:hypothetical protein